MNAQESTWGNTQRDGQEGRDAYLILFGVPNASQLFLFSMSWLDTLAYFSQLKMATPLTMQGLNNWFLMNWRHAQGQFTTCPRTTVWSLETGLKRGLWTGTRNPKEPALRVLRLCPIFGQWRSLYDLKPPCIYVIARFISVYLYSYIFLW